uniref:PDZ domain-containing protein n=1 Tax=Rodentolepis nana TaxID=102285 RepID=A0A0R3T6H9_RODNA
LNLHNLFHLGDMLISINGYEVYTLRQFKKTVDVAKRNAAQERQRTPDAAFNSSSEVKLWLRLRRLPLAKTLIVCRQFRDQKIGISFDDKGTNKVKRIDPNGPLACAGLLPLAQPFMRKSSAKSTLRSLTTKQTMPEPELVPWTVTEINHRLLDPLFRKHETLTNTLMLQADLLIGARGMEISVTLQPSDFMEAICKKLRKSKFYQSFFKNP